MAPPPTIRALTWVFMSSDSLASDCALFSSPAAPRWVQPTQERTKPTPAHFPPPLFDGPRVLHRIAPISDRRDTDVIPTRYRPPFSGLSGRLNRPKRPPLGADRPRRAAPRQAISHAPPRSSAEAKPRIPTLPVRVQDRRPMCPPQDRKLRTC